MDKLEKAAVNVLRNCMNVKKNEKVLIITDSKLLRIGNVFLDKAKKIAKSADLIKIPVPEVSGTEPPKKTAKLMLGYDIILGITFRSISHTKARKNANNACPLQ